MAYFRKISQKIEKMGIFVENFWENFIFKTLNKEIKNSTLILKNFKWNWKVGKFLYRKLSTEPKNYTFMLSFFAALEQKF